MSVSRRYFLKYCVGAAAALGLDFSTLGPMGRKLLAAGGDLYYPISRNVETTLDRTVIAKGSPPLGPNARIYPSQISLYKQKGYGEWVKTPGGFPGGPKAPYGGIDMDTGDIVAPPESDPNAVRLLSFVTMSDMHICDKETPAQAIYNGYQYPNPVMPGAGNQSAGNASCYSGIMLYTTHVLDAAVQTINALHKQAPLDFGIFLGDAADNTQHNELRWYLDVIDGKMITPSSGANLGAGNIDYQKPYQAAGLDKSLKWYQAVGNHDQFWKGSTFWTNHLRNLVVGSGILNMGAVTSLPPDFPVIMNERGLYMGVVDGSTPYGTVIAVGPQKHYLTPPAVAADPNRRALSLNQWMGEFFNTTTQPAGHGFTRQMVDGTSSAPDACYSFYPRADLPIKVIVFDDTDTSTGGALGYLDEARYNWLMGELDAGQTNDELMIVCSHVPVWPYGYQPPTDPGSIWNPDSYVPQSTSMKPDQYLVNTISSTYSNVVLWIAGHVHRNTITPHPDATSPGSGYGFWHVETASLRDFPQQLRRFEIVRSSDKQTISILVVSVDPAVNPAPLPDGSQSPALISRSYAIAAQQIYGNTIQQGNGMDAASGVWNAQLVIKLNQLSSVLQTKLKAFSE